MEGMAEGMVEGMAEGMADVMAEGMDGMGATAIAPDGAIIGEDMVAEIIIAITGEEHQMRLAEKEKF
jgi:hypothetical protein